MMKIQKGKENVKYFLSLFPFLSVGEKVLKAGL